MFSNDPEQGLHRARIGRRRLLAGGAALATAGSASALAASAAGAQAAAALYDVTDYGATGNGVTDDTAAIKAAFAAAESLGQQALQVVYFPPGLYQFNGSSPILISRGTSVLGAGSGSTRIRFTGDRCNFVRYISPGIRGWFVRSLGFRTSVDCQSGELIRVEDTSSVSQDAIIEDINARGAHRFHTGIRLRPGTQEVTMRDLNFGPFSARAIWVENSHNNTLEDFFLRGPDDGTGVGIQLTATAGRGIEAFQCFRGLVVNYGRALEARGPNPTRFSGVTNSKFAHVYFDDSKLDDSAFLEGVGNTVFTDCYFVSAKRNGAWLRDSNHIQFNGCQFDKNEQHGLRIENTSSDIQVIGGSAKDNNDLQSAANYSGIWIEGGTPGASGIIVQGVDCKGSTPVYGKAQGFGITVGSTCNQFVIVGNDLRGNRVQGILNTAGTSPSKVVANNLL